MAQFAGTIDYHYQRATVHLAHAHNKSLLNALREDAGLTGTKKAAPKANVGLHGVAERQAVMSCLVPAPQAHSAHVITIEGLADTAPNAPLHPLQQAFIDHAPCSVASASQA